jgi:hypothetical protein
MSIVRWTADSTVHGGWRTEGAAAPRQRAARERWSSLVLASDEGGGRAGRGGAREVLTADGGVATRRRTGGSERRRLELVTRVKEGAKHLRREGMRCNEILGSHRPFIGAGEAPERGGRGGVTAVLMALTPLKTGARLRGGLRGEMMAGRVTARAASEGGVGSAGWPEATRRSGNSRPAWRRGWS